MYARIAPKPAIIAAILEAILLYALIVGLGFTIPGSQTVTDTLKTFDLTMPPPDPPPPPPVQHKSGRPEGAAAPAGLRAKASAIVAPLPPIPLPPPPIAAAPVAGVGTQSHQGASAVDAGGTGAGGVGNGLGSGGRGDGDGGGGGRDTPPRRIGGDIRYSDFEQVLDDPGEGLDIEVAYRVELDGRVSSCRVVRHSSNLAADERMCQLIVERFRFRPARDEDGPHTATIYERQGLYAREERAEDR